MQCGSNKQFIYVAKNGLPIGFKPTMSNFAMNANKRFSVDQLESFKLTSYDILADKLPWKMDAIEFLWNFDIANAREITFELRKIDLQARKLIHSSNI